MLGVSSYPQEYLAASRAAVERQLAAYDAVAATADSAALDAFAPRFFAHLVLALDMYFCHRLRGKEGKDGNAMNEVRLLSTSIRHHDGVLAADKQITLKPETSVLGLAAGDDIVIDRDGFARLADAYFNAVASTFV